MTLPRYRQAKLDHEDPKLVGIDGAVPKSTRYNNKWACGILEHAMADAERDKFPLVEVSGLFFGWDESHVFELLPFWAGVEEKLIRDRTGHRSNTLFKFI